MSEESVAPGDHQPTDTSPRTQPSPESAVNSSTETIRPARDQSVGRGLSIFLFLAVAFVVGVVLEMLFLLASLKG